MYLFIYTQTRDKSNAEQPSIQKIQGKPELKLSAGHIQMAFEYLQGYRYLRGKYYILKTHSLVIWKVHGWSCFIDNLFV